MLQLLFFAVICKTIIGQPAIQISRYCQTQTVRQEIRSSNITLFNNAFKSLLSDGTLAKFINIHGPKAYWYKAHFNPVFLLWHRSYLREFELLLQSRGCPYIPYWDWEIDASSPIDSPILTSEYLGGQLADKTVTEPYDIQNPIDGKRLVRDYSTLPKFYKFSQINGKFVSHSFNNNTFSLFYFLSHG